MRRGLYLLLIAGGDDLWMIEVFRSQPIQDLSNQSIVSGWERPSGSFYGVSTKQLRNM